MIKHCPAAAAGAASEEEKGPSASFCRSPVYFRFHLFPHFSHLEVADRGIRSAQSIPQEENKSGRRTRRVPRESRDSPQCRCVSHTDERLPVRRPAVHKGRRVYARKSPMGVASLRHTTTNAETTIALSASQKSCFFRRAPLNITRAQTSPRYIYERTGM